MPKYQLEFFMPLPVKSKSKLIEGSLTLLKGGKPILEVRASSGQPGHQYLGNYWKTALSPIPPGKYSVNLYWEKPTSMEKLAMGSRFYYIIPNTIYSPDRTKSRSGIGIHYDANFDYSPGTAGCIGALPRVSEPYGWAKMMHELDNIYNSGIKTIPLLVRYK